MRQIGQRPERGPSLVIDQNQGEARGRQIEGELEQPGDQQLGLARSGCARHERMRAVTDQIGAHRPLAADSAHLVHLVHSAHSEHCRERVGPTAGLLETPVRPDPVTIHPSGDVLQNDVVR